jgi:hypothetical protein
MPSKSKRPNANKRILPSKSTWDKKLKRANNSYE